MLERYPVERSKVSCRLTQEQRIVYLVRDERIDFLQARYHY
jgi:toxin YoeB